MSEDKEIEELEHLIELHALEAKRDRSRNGGWAVLINAKFMAGKIIKEGYRKPPQPNEQEGKQSLCEKMFDAETRKSGKEVKWPEKKYVPEGTVGELDKYEGEREWNACHDAFMQVLESRES